MESLSTYSVSFQQSLTVKGIELRAIPYIFFHHGKQLKSKHAFDNIVSIPAQYYENRVNKCNYSPGRAKYNIRLYSLRKNTKTCGLEPSIEVP